MQSIDQVLVHIKVYWKEATGCPQRAGCLDSCSDQTAPCSDRRRSWYEPGEGPYIEAELIDSVLHVVKKVTDRCDCVGSQICQEGEGRPFSTPSGSAR